MASGGETRRSGAGRPAENEPKAKREIGKNDPEAMQGIRRKRVGSAPRNQAVKRSRVQCKESDGDEPEVVWGTRLRKRREG